MTATMATRLEQYTAQHPQEVLLVQAEIEGERDEIVIFRGFSSSLVRSTAADPDVPILPDTAQILSLDRLRGPYNPAQPQYIQQGLTWEDFQPILTAAGC
uniref:DUF7734 domain-containing protein n=1 Tax=Cyanothece sp. (strain PCC 7425 / ATCC 29141) TaxID=395961 RepID=B8HUM4_CYAP4